MISMIPASDLPNEEKILRMAEVMKNITKLTVRALKTSIAAVRTPSAVVTDTDHIEEFLSNCDRTVFNIVRDQVIALRQANELKPLSLVCTECGTKYDQQLSLDMANFFVPAS